MEKKSLYYKGYITPGVTTIDDKEHVFYQIQTNECDFIFREVKKYAIPVIEQYHYTFKFIPTNSPKFGRTHVLSAIGVNSDELDERDGQGNVIKNRRILIHGGSQIMHSSGCWLPYSFKEKRYIRGFRFPSDTEVIFDLLGQC